MSRAKRSRVVRFLRKAIMAGVSPKMMASPSSSDSISEAAAAGLRPGKTLDWGLDGASTCGMTGCELAAVASKFCEE